MILKEDREFTAAFRVNGLDVQLFVIEDLFIVVGKHERDLLITRFLLEMLFENIRVEEYIGG